MCLTRPKEICSHFVAVFPQCSLRQLPERTSSESNPWHNLATLLAWIYLFWTQNLKAESPYFHMFWRWSYNTCTFLLCSWNPISISTAWAAAARSVSLDWSVSDAALTNMNNAIKNSTPKINLKSFSTDNKPADSTSFCASRKPRMAGRPLCQCSSAATEKK